MSETRSAPIAFVIEDDVDLSTIFAEALKSAGCKTEVLRTGDGAMRRLKEVVAVATAIPDIVVLDLHLPNVSGADILDYIRADARFNRVRVMVASADPRMADTLQDQADLVLIKPISFSQMRDLAKRLVAVS